MGKRSKVSDKILGSSSVHSFLLNMKQNLLGNEGIIMFHKNQIREFLYGQF